MEIALIVIFVTVVLKLSALVTPKNICQTAGCYKLYAHEYDGLRLCRGHYVIRKHDPYLEYAFF